MSNATSYPASLNGVGPQRARPRYAQIVGWGMALPERIVTNDDLARMVDTSDEWIRSRTGIQERRMATSPKESTATLAVQAAREALRVADVPASALDLVICATTSPEHLCPSTACLVQDALGAPRAGAFDLNAGLLWLRLWAGPGARPGGGRRCGLRAGDWGGDADPFSGLDRPQHLHPLRRWRGRGAGGRQRGTRRHPELRAGLRRLRRRAVDRAGRRQRASPHHGDGGQPHAHAQDGWQGGFSLCRPGHGRRHARRGGQGRPSTWPMWTW
jgi:hypothetical protein